MVGTLCTVQNPKGFTKCTSVTVLIVQRGETEAQNGETSSLKFAAYALNVITSLLHTDW